MRASAQRACGLWQCAGVRRWGRDRDPNREAALDRAFAEGFARLPGTDEELAVAEALARLSINEETWQPWW